MRICVMFCLFITQTAWASMGTSYQSGESYAKTLQEKSKGTLTHQSLKEVPGFQTETPPEVSLNKNGDFNDAIQGTLLKNEAGQAIIDHSKKYQRFKIDPKTDPLFTVFSKQSPEEILKTGNQEAEIITEQTEEKTCEEGGEAIDLTCHEDLRVQVNQQNGSVYIQVRYPNLISRILIGSDVRSEKAFKGIFHFPSHLWDAFFKTHHSIVRKDLNFFKTKVCPALVSWGKINIDCNSVQRYSSDHSDNTCDIIVSARRSESFYGWLRLNIQYQTHHTTEAWHSDCQTAESLVEEGVCQYGDRTCSIGPQTRHFNGYPVYKDCWQYRQNYHCKMIKDECSPLRSQGCFQSGSTCKEMREGRCWIYQQKYQCPTGRLTSHPLKSPTTETFCLTGNCHNTSYEANKEMLEVMSRLNLFKEIQEDIRAQGNDQFQIFTGKSQQCSRNCISFKDCCGGLKGWGVSLHIAGCSSEEKELAKMRERSLCHSIGTYCSHKILGKCVSKKTSFCCFSSKFARLLQEQGRAQLGLGWGEAKCPDCRGISVQELSRMDLSTMNFSEVFEEVIKKYKAPDLKALQDNTHQKINQNIQNIEEGLKQKTIQPSGVLHDPKNGL